MTHQQAFISELWSYPVKSCAGVSLNQATLTETGLEWDRAWMVLNKQGQMVTQRQLPSMALIQTKIRSQDVILRAPGMLALHISLYEAEQPAQAGIWGETVQAYDMGDLAAQWFTDYLSQTSDGKAIGPFRLARFDPECQRLSDPGWTQGKQALNQFSDGFPLLIIGQASLKQLDQLRQSTANNPSDPVLSQRFRPNIVIAGLDPHAEDVATSFQIETPQGMVVLKPVKPCVRCSIPDIDPSTGLVDGSMTPVLRTYRQDLKIKGRLTFGMNAIIEQGLVAASDEAQEPVLKTGQTVKPVFD